jgi:hypothetical protein
MAASSLAHSEFPIPLKFERPGYHPLTRRLRMLRADNTENTARTVKLPLAFANYVFRKFFKSDRSIGTNVAA